MNKEQAEKLKLNRCIFHKGYESKVLEIKDNRATWYDPYIFNPNFIEICVKEMK